MINCDSFLVLLILYIFKVGSSDLGLQKVSIVEIMKNSCIPGNKTKNDECNVCLCINAGIPVCTKIPCNKVPEDMWNTINLKEIQTSDKLRAFNSTTDVKDVVLANTLYLDFANEEHEVIKYQKTSNGSQLVLRSILEEKEG